MNRTTIPLATAKHVGTIPTADQLGFYLIAGVAIPAISWGFVRDIPLDTPKVLSAILQVVLANLGVWYALSRLRRYARARLLSYVLPANVVAFGIIIAINALLRTGISWSLVLACAMATVIISYLVTVKIRHRNPMLVHYLVPGGDVSRLEGQGGFVVLESASELETLSANEEIEGSIVADLYHDQPPQWTKALAAAALKGIPVYHFRLIEESLTGEVRVTHLRENDFGTLIPNSPYRPFKRAIDLSLVLSLAPVLIPLMAVIALVIRLDGSGGVFFRQERLGYRGRFFTMVKFRTMRDREVAQNTASLRNDAVTQDEDERITRVGRWLRKTRMDELPQVWNILKGEMSWIGPRPEAAELAKWYEEELPFYSYRHIVQPGITGWAQVNQGHVSAVDDVKKKLRFDFYYIKNLSLWLDILIALKTIRVILGGIGAK